MKRCDIHPRIGLLVLALWGLGGCIEYRIDTTLEADGSGTRSEELRVDEDEDAGSELERRQFVELMNLSERDGWTYSLELVDDDSVHLFRRQTRIADPAGWRDLTRSVHIAGTTRAHARSSVGYVRLGEVHFWNDVNVETARTREGTTYTYRETLYWVNALDLLIEFLMTQLREGVESRYPDLPPARLGEIVGLARGQLWAAMDQGLLDPDGDGSEELLAAAIDRTATVAAKIAGQRQPQADDEYFRALLEEVYDDEEDRLSDFLDEKLPGFNLGPGFVFRLRMPGRIVSSNADEQDGEVLVWKFNAGDGLSDPIEIIAESRVTG